MTGKRTGTKGGDSRPARPRRAKRRRGAHKGVPLHQGAPLYQGVGQFRGIGARLPKLPPSPWRGRHGRGAGALLGVMLLAVLAGGALAVHYETREAERAQALDRAAGRVFAGWVQGAHRATQVHADAFETALETQTGILLTVARLRQLGAAPPGLPERPGRAAAMALGVIPDGAARSVPMAFGVLEPDGASRPSAMREGALEAGLAALAPAGGPLMEAHRPAIEAVLGRSLGPDALFVTADRGLRYRERVLYRRAQPGRPWLNRMETALAMAPPGTTDPADPARRNIAEAGTVGAEAAEIGLDVAVGRDGEFGGRADAAGVSAGTVEAGDVAGATMRVDADLVVGAAVTGALNAGSVTATGGLEAAALRTEGVLDAAALSVAGTATVQGAAATGDVAGETLGVAQTLGAGRTAAGGVYGPDATITGLLTVGSCAGCEGE